MANFPMTFSAQASSPSGITTPWSTSTPTSPELACAIPAEFEGTATGASPEDLFILALTNCFIATFKVVAEKSKVAFGDLKARSTLTLDRGADGVPWVAAAHLHFTLTGSANAERATRLLERVSKQCMIINSVKTAVSFEFTVSA
jgi:organic hydroperoxide reductase OsmC/OhrA